MRFLDLKKRVEGCIKYGDFTMSSGQKTKWMCDLLECRDIFPELLYELIGVDVKAYGGDNVFGIETGGYLIASSTDAGHVGLIRKTGELYYGRYSSVKKGNKERKLIRVIDDVVSTEKLSVKPLKLLQQTILNVR